MSALEAALLAELRAARGWLDADRMARESESYGSTWAALVTLVVMGHARSSVVSGVTFVRA